MSSERERLGPDRIEGSGVPGASARAKFERFSDEAIRQAVTAVANTLGIRSDRQIIRQNDASIDLADPLDPLLHAAEQLDISLRKAEFRSAAETFEIVVHGYPVVFATSDARLIVLSQLDGKKVEATIATDEVEHRLLGQRELEQFVKNVDSIHMFVAEKELQCDSLSTESNAAAHGTDAHAKPLDRFIALLDLDRRDVSLVILFAGVSGILALATPLVIESLVNVVSWGIYFQPLLVLAGMLMLCLGVAGILKVLQTWVVEIIQRRQFVRIIGDLAHRFPRANQDDLSVVYPRELANRVFDVMTIQKATSVLLMDGVSIVLTTIFGLFLLAFYHPFLLGFDLVLVISMIAFTWVLGRGGIRTAISESKTKYEVAHWLQDVISMPSAFKIGGGESMAIRRANQLTVEYVVARKRQFGVVIRQVIFAVSLQVIASTALLGLGGWLVIDGQLTLGQLVASELVVTVVVGAFAKAGKSLEKFYDLMAGIDKVGYLLDVHADPRGEIGELDEGPATVEWTDLRFKTLAGKSFLAASKIEAGQRVAVVGDNFAGKSLFAKTVGGLLGPKEGIVRVAGFDVSEVAVAVAGKVTAYAGKPEIFHGSIYENVDLGRTEISQYVVRNALTQAGLDKTVMDLPDGLKTKLLSEGAPLPADQQAQLMIARAIASSPKVLVIDGLLDQITPQNRQKIWESLSRKEAPWTLIVVTHRDDVAQLCDDQIAFHR